MDANHCFQFFNIVLSISVSLPGHHLLPSTWSSWNSLYRTSWLLTPSAGIKVCASMPSFHLSFLKWDAKAVCAHISLTPQLIGPELKRTDSSTHSLVSSPLLSFPASHSFPPPSLSTQNPISWDKRMSNWYPSPANGSKLRKLQTPWDPLG